MKLLALALAATLAGCGTLFNSGPATISAPPGTAIDGSFDVTQVSKKRSHQVQYANGRTCLIRSKVSPIYVVGDLFFTDFLGLIIDAATDGWKTLDASNCPNVSVD